MNWRDCTHRNFKVDIQSMSCDEFVCTLGITCSDCENLGYLMVDYYYDSQIELEYNWHNEQCMEKFETSYDPAERFCICGID